VAGDGQVSPALEQVSFDQETHIFRRSDGERVLSVTQILAKAGLCDFSAVPAEFRDRGLKRGTSVHWLTQLEDEGALDYRTVPKSLRPYRKGWNAFKAATGFHPIAIEFKFIFDDFAGIIDRAGSFPPTSMFSGGTHAILDIKSGAAIPDHTRFQLCAYSVGFMQNIALARFVRRIAVRLTPDGKYSVKEFPLSSFDTDWSTFCRAKEKANAAND
jgi:hypothetical protein